MARITEEEAIKRLKDKITTMEHGAISSNYGNDKELFEIAIKAMESSKDEVILTKKEYGELVSSEYENGYAKGYREALENEKLAIARYQDLVDYFSDECVIKTILENGDEFKKWLDRIKWNVRKVDELARKLEKLEQEPCEDCVSRQAAQAKIKSICEKYGLSYEDGERKVATGGSAYALGHAFDDLPSVRPERSKWTFINERLPESDGKYLVVEKTGRVCSYVFHKEGNSEEYWERCIIAWAPLPKLYNETEHNLENTDQINSKNEADEPEL